MSLKRVVPKGSSRHCTGSWGCHAAEGMVHRTGIFSAGRSPSRARSNRQWAGYFVYKRLANTGGKEGGGLPAGNFQLAEKSFPRRFFGSKSKKEFKCSGNSETLPRCDQHEVRQLRCWR